MFICWFWIVIWVIFYVLDLNMDCMEGLANRGNLYIGNQYYRYLTGAFLHVNLLHLLANAVTMYYIGIFLSQQMEDMVGDVRLIILTIVAGTLSGGIFSLYAPGCIYSIGGSVIVFTLFGLISYFQIFRRDIQRFRWNTAYGKWIMGYIFIGNIPWFSDSFVSTMVIHCTAFVVGFLVASISFVYK